MSKQFTVAGLKVAGNVVNVTVTAADDGSLTIFDYSYGPAADLFYGEDSDVEVWLTLSPDSVKQVARCVCDAVAERPADAVARYLASYYRDDGRMLGKVQAQLDKLDIPYEKAMWP